MGTHVKDPHECTRQCTRGARALENGIEKIARRHGCSAVHTTIASSSNQRDDGWLCTVLHERGHRIEGLHLCKLIPA